MERTMICTIDAARTAVTPSVKLIRQCGYDPDREGIKGIVPRVGLKPWLGVTVGNGAHDETIKDIA